MTERSEPKVEWSGAERLAEFAENDGAERSGAERGAGTERRARVIYRNSLERGAASSPLTLRSHALVAWYTTIFLLDIEKLDCMSFVQYKCCGVTDYKDWRTNSHYNKLNSVPDSCCKTETKGCGKGGLKNPAKINTMVGHGCIINL